MPDVSTFQALPATWGDENPADDRSDKSSSSFPSYALGFTGADDVILFHANWTDLEAVVRMARMPGGCPHESFAQTQNVGLGTRGLLQGWSREVFPRCHRHRECLGDTNACPADDACRLEPLPGFLTLFPQLRVLYLTDAKSILIVPQYMSMIESDCKFEFRDSFEGFPFSDEGWVEKNGTMRLYRCPSKRDVWPVFQAVDFARRAFVAFDDRDEWCLLPNHRFYLARDPKVREIRRKWRHMFPWYKSLQHLETKLMAELLIR